MALIDNITRYFTNDENAANTTVVDSTGTENATASTNTANLFDASGKINSAFTFNGTTEYVDSNFDYVVDASNPLSISFWFKTTSASADRLLGSLKEGGAVDPRIQIFMNIVANKIGFQIQGDGGTQISTSGSTTINDDNYHHVLLVLTTTTQKLYLDGNATPEISETTNTGDVTLTGNDFFIGALNLRGSASDFFDGTIDEVGFWTEELTATNASELYNSGSGFAYPFGIAAPTTQATSVLYSNILETSFTIDFTAGNGAKRAVFMKEATTGTAAPVDLTTYTANTIFGSGTQIGSSGWFCVLNGTTTTASITGLTEATTYRTHVCEYNE